jgi:hypothetical protein
MGIEIFNPRTDVVMSMVDTSISMRGRNLARGDCSKINRGPLIKTDTKC